MIPLPRISFQDPSQVQSAAASYLPAGVVHLCKYLWVMKSYQGEPCEDVFYSYYQAHNSAKKFQRKGVQYKLEFGGCSFRPHKNEMNYFVPCSRNKWTENIYQAWLYVQVSPSTGVVNGKEVVSWSLASMVFECHPNNGGIIKSLRKNSNNDIYLSAVCLESGRDLVEEFIAVDIWPLSADWGFSEFVQRSIPLVDSIVLFPVFEVTESRILDLGLIEMVESNANILVGKYSLTEHNLITRKVSHKGRLNRVFIQYKVEYSQRSAPQAPLKRQTSHSAPEAPSKRRSNPGPSEASATKRSSDAAPRGSKKSKREIEPEHGISNSKKRKIDSRSLPSA